jgi:hypothetical protein
MAWQGKSMDAAWARRVMCESALNVPVLCFVFGLMMVQLAETCRRIFNIDYQYILCL